MGIIFHITSAQEWLASEAKSHYEVDSLKDEGFIHCSTVGQVLGVASRYYLGRDDLVLLCIDEILVKEELLYEVSSSADSSGERYPHIYGPLNMEAIVRVVDFPPQGDGSFLLPGELQDLL